MSINTQLLGLREFVVVHHCQVNPRKQFVWLGLRGDPFAGVYDAYRMASAKCGQGRRASMIHSIRVRFTSTISLHAVAE